MNLLSKLESVVNASENLTKIEKSGKDTQGKGNEENSKIKTGQGN